MSNRLPPEFLDGLDPRARWMYETIDRLGESQEEVCRTLEAMDERLEKGEDRFAALETDVKALNQAKLILTSKWSVVTLLVGAVLWPILLLILGKWVMVTIGATAWLGR